jgi:N-acetyl sugar amidotransferase
MNASSPEGLRYSTSRIGFRECTRCVMDTSDERIQFDANGVCNHCHDGDRDLAALPTESEGDSRLAPLVARIKAGGVGREYDAILGLSGGVDSSYAAILAHRHGIRALAVHFDNGWNSELAVENIQRIVEATGFDLRTYVIDWPEFRDLQRAFLKASVIDIEMLTDHAILASLVRLAREHDIPFILSGTNHATEHGMPHHWVWSKADWTNIKDIHARFGSVPLKTYPHLTRRRWLAMHGFDRGPQIVEPLELVHYRRDLAVETLHREIGWRDYGGKHHESVFTRFYQSWILPRKFGVDKRLVHLSARIRNGEITRAQAEQALEQPLYPSVEALATEREFVLKKLGFTEAEFEAIMADPPKPHSAYRSDRPFLRLVEQAYRPVRALRNMGASSMVLLGAGGVILAAIGIVLLGA